MQTFIEKYYIAQWHNANTQKYAWMIIATVFMVFSFSVFGLYLVRLNEVRVAKPTCSSFSSYAEALQAYNKGARYLDHNQNGFPCQSLLK